MHTLALQGGGRRFIRLERRSGFSVHDHGMMEGRNLDPQLIKSPLDSTQHFPLDGPLRKGWWESLVYLPIAEPSASQFADVPISTQA